MTRYGWMAEFGKAEQLTGAVLRLRERGFKQVDAYTPYPVPGLAEALGKHHTRLSLAVLVGGLIGGIGTLGLEYYAATIAYPMNIGGRPNASWPAFLPPALEMVFLGAVVFGVLGFLLANRLPKFYHPVFNIDRFTAASRNGFFLVIRSDDPFIASLGDAAVRELLDSLSASSVCEVSP